MQTSHFALYQGLSPPVQWSTKRKKIKSLKKENPPNEKCQSQAKKKKNRQEDRFTNTRNVLIIQSKLCWIELSALRTLHESSTLWIFFLGDSITKTNSVWNDKLATWHWYAVAITVHLSYWLVKHYLQGFAWNSWIALENDFHTKNGRILSIFKRKMIILLLHKNLLF